MRIFLVTLMFGIMLFPSLTNAKFYWYDIQEEQDGIVYYDFYNSTLIDNEITYYKLINFNEPIGKESNIKSLIYFYSLNCNTTSSTYTSLKAYRGNMGSGDLIRDITMTKEEQEEGRRYITSAEKVYGFYRSVCDTVRGIGLPAYQDIWKLNYKGE